MNAIQKKIDELVKQSDYQIAKPETIEIMKSKGLPIKSVPITYDEYIEKLFEEKKKLSGTLIKKFPHLNDSVANATIQSLYDELRECFVLGIPGAGITLSVILIELAFKYRLYQERLKDDPKSSWSRMEQLHFSDVVEELRKKFVITEDEKNELDTFNRDVRNSYIHYNIQKLVKDMVIEKLPSINIATGEVVIETNVGTEDKPHLWFSAKKVLDKRTIVSIVTFVVDWTNKMLSRAEE